MKFGIGQPVLRTEDPRLITGQGRYLDDIVYPHMAYAYVVRSPHASAKIKSIDTKAAEAMEGVVAIMTGADYEKAGLGKMETHAIPVPFCEGPPAASPASPLAVGKVRFVGEPVAFIVADTYEQAAEAAEAVEVDYEEMKPVVTLAQAMADGAPQLWDGSSQNKAFTLNLGGKEPTDEAISKAEHVTKITLRNNRLIANSMEMRGSIGVYQQADQRFTLHTSTQAPHPVRMELSHALHVPETAIRVIADDVGGGFGLKGSPYPEDILVCWASKVTGRPIKWRCQRTEAFTADCHGRDQEVWAELALKKDGTILGLRTEAIYNTGAYLTSAGPVTPFFHALLVSGVYKIPAIHSRVVAVYSNIAPTCPYRGAGRPEAGYLTERLMDQAARELGMDPVEFRRKNLVQPSDMPYQTPLLFAYDCGEFETVMNKGMELADWNGFAARKAASEKAGKKRGRGLAIHLESATIFNEQAEIRFDPSGAATVIVGTFSHGQGHETAFPQMVSDWLGIPFESIKFIQGDTDKVSIGRGTYGSRSASIGGSALRRAADKVIERGRQLAAGMLESPAEEIEFADGIYSVKGTNKTIDLVSVAQASYNPMAPDEAGIGIEGTGTFGTPGPNFPNGCQVAEVEIDPETGVVKLERITSVDDVGNIINPLLLDGQIIGGLAQGIGQALCENIEYDPESGQLLSASFMDYCMPRADDFPNFEVDYHVVPTKTNPLGVKGAGEIGTVGGTPAVMSAVIDALSDMGVTDVPMPATPQAVWKVIQDAKAA